MTRGQFDSWLNWNLKHGSHDFPGPDGGTCINEAAVVVAGFSYREVTSIRDLPESFCPVVSQFALTLNDALPEGDLLNKLRPYAARLSGSSGGRKTAIKRVDYLALATAKSFVPLALRPLDPATANQLENAHDASEALSILNSVTVDDLPREAREAVGAAIRALSRTIRGKEAIYTAELAAICAARSADVDPEAWDAAIAALDGALGIGKQADPIETKVIRQRAAGVLALR